MSGSAVLLPMPHMSLPLGEAHVAECLQATCTKRCIAVGEYCFSTVGKALLAPNACGIAIEGVYAAA
jgi:hypothetical protein